MFCFRITAGPSTTAFHKKRLKDLEKKKLEEKNAEAKAALIKEIQAKIDQEEKEKEEREKRRAEAKIKKANDVSAGIVIMSKKKSKDWLNVPTRRLKAKYPTFDGLNREKDVKKMNAEEYAIEASDEPVILAGGRANLLDVRVAELMRKDPERDCRKYNVKARAKEIFKALDVDKDGLVDEDEFIEGIFDNHYLFSILFPGCMLDEVFVGLLISFDGEKLWGQLGI